MKKNKYAIFYALIAFGIGCYYRYQVSIGNYKINDPQSWLWSLTFGLLMLFSSNNIENSHSLKLITKILGIVKIGIGIIYLAILII